MGSLTAQLPSVPMSPTGCRQHVLGWTESWKEHLIHPHGRPVLVWNPASPSVTLPGHGHMGSHLDPECGQSSEMQIRVIFLSFCLCGFCTYWLLQRTVNFSFWTPLCKVVVFAFLANVVCCSFWHITLTVVSVLLTITYLSVQWLHCAKANRRYYLLPQRITSYLHACIYWLILIIINFLDFIRPSSHSLKLHGRNKEFHMALQIRVLSRRAQVDIFKVCLFTAQVLSCLRSWFCTTTWAPSEHRWRLLFQLFISVQAKKVGYSSFHFSVMHRHAL